MDLKEVLEFYKNKRVFITGHTGFKGSWFCEILSLAGAKVLGHSLPAPSDSLFHILDLGSRIDSIFADIRDLNRLKSSFDDFKPDIVFHLAAQPLVLESYENPAYTFDVNVMGTVNMLECIRNYSSKCSFVNVTTDKVYLNREWEWGYREYERLDGFDPYSNSKSCSELVTSSYKRSFFGDNPDIAISTARAGNVIGGGDFAENRIIPDCVRAAIANKNIIVRNPNSTRPYQHVLEPLFAYLIIAKKQYEDGELQGSYNVGPGDEGCYTTRQLVESFIKFWGEGLDWNHPEQVDSCHHEANFLKLDNTKIRNMLGWSPVWNLDETMKSIVKWTRAWQSGMNMIEVTDSQINQFVLDSYKK